MRDCERCVYFGVPADAPETVEKDCMWTPSEDDGEHLPCEVGVLPKWILCSERMPQEHDSIFAKFKGTDIWNNAMFEKISDNVNVTVVDENGKGATTYAHTTDGKWSCDLLRCNKEYRIIAWQPFPEPYKPEGE